LTDLITRLQTAAAEAIANERQGLTYDVARLRGVTVELEVSLSGHVVVGNCWIQRKGRAGQQKESPA
jgi:hypothetical protein